SYTDYCALCSVLNLIAKYTNTGMFLTAWEVPDPPTRIAIDASGSVYFSTSSSVQKFTGDAGTLVTIWAGYGSPVGLAVDGSGNVFFADFTNSLVRKFTNTGSFLAQWGSQVGLYGPTGIALDGSGNVYVAESAYSRVMKFTNDGTFLGMWGGYGPGDGKFL